MHQDLVLLIELQKIDVTIHEFLNSKKELPEQLKELEAIIQKATDALAGANQKILDIQTEKKAVTQKIADLEVKRSKSQDRINSITTNREYDAVHTEIESNKHSLENSQAILKNLEVEENQLTEKISAYEEEIAKAREANMPRITEIKEKVAGIDAQIATATAQRDKIVPSIGKTFLRPYEHILTRRKNGVVLSMVNGQRTCGICHKVLEIQLVNEIRKGNKQLICNNCGSIFIWEPTEDVPVQQ